MFTGIIEKSARVLEFSENILSISRPQHFEILEIGQSIAVNGACLSVAAFDNEKICFFLAEETQKRTNLAKQAMVNLERAMMANGRFEGHVVLGHVDGLATFVEQKEEDHFFELPENLAHLCVEKGSITLNGVSLTIASIKKNQIRVAIIPLTAERTNIGALKSGNEVNVEADYLAKLLHKWHG